MIRGLVIIEGALTLYHVNLEQKMKLCIDHIQFDLLKLACGPFGRKTKRLLVETDEFISIRIVEKIVRNPMLLSFFVKIKMLLLNKIWGTYTKLEFNVKTMICVYWSIKLCGESSKTMIHNLDVKKYNRCFSYL